MSSNGRTPATRSKSFFFLMVTILTLMVNCAPELDEAVNPVSNRGESKTFKANPAVVREAVKRVFEKRDLEVDVEHTTPWHIQTEWQQLGMFRSFIQADIKPISPGRSELTLYVTQEKRELRKEIWHPMDVIGDKVYYDLIVEVDLEIYRVIYDPT